MNSRARLQPFPGCQALGVFKCKFPLRQPWPPPAGVAATPGGKTRFKLVIKHCTKLDFDLVQNSTGPCSLTCHPPFCPIVPWRGCLLSEAVRQAVTSCCFSGCLPPGELGKPWKSKSTAFPAFLATSAPGTRQEWSG